MALRTRLRLRRAVVLDDDAGVRGQVGAQVGVDPSGIGDRGGHTVVDQTPGQRAALDEELDLEDARQHPVQGPNEQLVLTDGERTHNTSL